MKFALHSRLLALLVMTLFLIIGGSASAEDRVVKNGDKVSIHYTGKLEDQQVFDTSEKRGPLEFTAGSGMLIPGMDNAVIGMKVGESKTVTIPPKEAYGERDESQVVEVDLKNLPPGVKPGAQLIGPDRRMVTVKEIKGDKAVLDQNHFLAGKTLIFDLKVVSIK